MDTKTILMAVTSCDRLDKDHISGLWLEEFALPYTAFTRMGYRVIVASPMGGPVPLDPRSIASGEKETYSQTLPALKNTLPLGRVLFEDYDALFLPGGHGPLVDLATSEFSQDMVKTFFETGKPVAAVCHGSAALVNVRLSDGRFLVEGRRITSFTNEEEKAVELDKIVPFALETALRERGAIFEEAPMWNDHVVEDGNLLTGQNPQSSGSLALKVIDLLEGPLDENATSRSRGTSLTGPDLEVSFNLWYVYDATGTVHALRAKPYVLPGSDADKLAFMEAFASSDFFIARQFPVPEPFLNLEEGQTPAFSVSNMKGTHALSVFEECMETLTGEFPPQTELKLPPNPLVNVTPLFLDEGGKLHSVTGNGEA